MDKLYNLQLVLFFIAINIIFVSCWNIDFKERENRFKQKEIYGVVFEKYRDKWNHNVPMIKYHSEISANNELGLSEWSKNSNLWNYIEVGDSVFKASGSLQLKIIKKSGETKVYKYNE